jgi:hypothetical protein
MTSPESFGWIEVQEAIEEVGGQRSGGADDGREGDGRLDTGKEGEALRPSEKFPCTASDSDGFVIWKRTSLTTLESIREGRISRKLRRRSRSAKLSVQSLNRGRPSSISAKMHPTAHMSTA